MKSLCRVTRRNLTHTFKRDLFKLAVQSPVSLEPRLFYFRRDSSLSSFVEALREEFNLTETPEVLYFDPSGQLAPVSQSDLSLSNLHALLIDNWIKVKVKDRTDSLLEVKFEPSSLDINRRFILEAAEDTLLAHYERPGAAPLKRESFDEFIRSSFAAQFRWTSHQRLKTMSQRIALNETILASVRSKYKDLLYQNIHSSKWPVRFLFMGSIAIGALLYYVTFCYKDWGVGEPLSYMIGLSIQLITVLGFFITRETLNIDFFFQRRLQKLNEEIKRSLYYSKSLEVKQKKFRLLFAIFSKVK